MRKVKKINNNNELKHFVLFYYFIILLFQFNCNTSIAQTNDDIVVAETKPKQGIRMYAEIVNGDTIPTMCTAEVYIIAEYAFKDRKKYEAWTRLKYTVKKVYPYAILAAAKLKEYNLVLEKLPTEKAKKAYLKVIEKGLKDEFEEPLKDLSIEQGKVLLKLIDRETGNTSYDLVKDLRGGFNAFVWQGVARLFGNNMKDKYDPAGEDMLVERAIKLVEAGQF